MAMAEKRTIDDDLPNNLFQTSFRQLYKKPVATKTGNNGRSSSSVSNISDRKGFDQDHVQDRQTIEIELIDFIKYSSYSKNYSDYIVTLCYVITTSPN